MWSACEASTSSRLARFLCHGCEPDAKAAEPKKPALSGGCVLDSPDVAKALAILWDAVPDPTDEEIAACSGGLLDAQGVADVRATIRAAAVARCALEWCAARLPANDV